jgi:hypothetical protein
MNQLFKEIIGQNRKKKEKPYLVTFEYCEATDHRSCGRFVCFYRRKIRKLSMQMRQNALMLLNVDGGIVVIVLLPCFPWLLAKLLLNPLGHMGVNVLGQVILAIETFTTFRTTVHFISSMNDRMPL